MAQETYLGDGLYASFDGWQIKLRAPRLDGEHVVYLEPELYRALTQFATSCWEVKQIVEDRQEDAGVEF